MMAEYIKVAGSLLAGVAAVMAAYNIGDGSGLARDGLLGHLSAKDARKQFGEEAAKSFQKIQHDHHQVHILVTGTVLGGDGCLASSK